MLLLIDNYDSFTYNLARYLTLLGQDVDVVRNDDAALQGDLSQRAAALVLSPGPQRPEDAGKLMRVVIDNLASLPMLGICLGHQAIVAACGGRIVRAQQPIHGRTTEMQIEKCPLFAGIPERAHFARYHSLVADRESLPDELRVRATSVDGDEIMAVSHITHPLYGVQFHPESVLSKWGMQVLANFLETCGLETPDKMIAGDGPQTLAESVGEVSDAIATGRPPIAVLPNQR